MQNKWLYIGMMLIFGACVREKDLPMPLPSIMLVNQSGNDIVQEPGKEVAIDASLQSLAGIRNVTVSVDGSVVKTEELDGRISHEYSYVYQVPEGQAIGSKLLLEVKVEDNEGKTASVQVGIVVDQPYQVDEITLDGTPYTRLKGKINRDITLTADVHWLVDSVLSVEEGAVMRIEPGTTVYFRTYAAQNKSSLLGIARGSSIIAEGTREQPIVFTSDRVRTGNPSAGDWGGLVVNGFAPTNRGGTVLSDGFRYGGNPADNSGRLRFIRIEYSGKEGYHGLHLHGVGSATQVSHIQVYQSYNNAVRLRGGRASLKYIAGIRHGGYGLWADEGWQGNGQFWLFQTDIPATLVPVNYWNQARSLEFRNDASVSDRQPRTTFRVSNVTLIGNGYTEAVADGTRRGIRVRQGSVGEIRNAIVTGFPDEGVRVEDLPLSDLGSLATVSHMRVFNNRINWGQEAMSFFFESGNFQLSEAPVPEISQADFAGTVSGGFNTSSMGSWFTAVSYIGAVDPTDDWTKGGSWFKDINGKIR
ncbi:MAG: hypothetical protein ABS46_20020 [Cytophagaceae bacterium SCN 52-12]|nr:MAG: hypothetical protein ABS46_20020 [Cytophagaceae bacterium SCN 52-12]